MPGINLAQKSELLLLLGMSDLFVTDVFDELVDLGVARVQVGSLKDARQKGGLPVLRLLNRIAPRAHGDEAGQVQVLGPQTVSDPRAHARTNLARVAAVHQHERWLMV